MRGMPNAKKLAAVVKMIELTPNFALDVFFKASDVFHGRGAIRVENDVPWIPYELRPVIYRQNPNAILVSIRGLTGYYLEHGDRTVVVVFTDRIVRSSYDDNDGFQSAISDLDSAKVRRIEFRHGVVRAILLFSVCILLLKCALLLGQVLW